MTIQDPLEITKEELNHFVRSLTVEGASARFFDTNVNFEAEGVESTIYTGVREVFDRSRLTKDAEGNEYLPSEVMVQVSSSTHASANPETTIARLQFCLKVAQLAQTIVDHFAGRDLRALYLSAEEKAQKSQDVIQGVVWAHCLSHVKGMRVDQTKVLKKPPQFIDGEFTCEAKDKTYRVKIVLDAIFVTRTK